jgi:tetratricopeptide (TPR) repeat protein
MKKKLETGVLLSLAAFVVFHGADAGGDILYEPGERSTAYYHYLKAQRSGDATEAIEELEKAIAILPEAPVLHAELTSIHYWLKDIEKAIASGTRALELDPENELASQILAKIYTKLIERSMNPAKFVGKAVTYWEIYKKSNPNNPEASAELGRLYYLQYSSGDKPDRTLLEKSVENFTTLDARYNLELTPSVQLAEMLTQLGRLNEAVPYYERAVRMKPDACELKIILAEIYSDESVGRLRDAISLYQSCLKASSEAGVARLSAAIARNHVRLFEFEEGERIVRELLKSLPEEEELKLLLAEILSKTSRTEEAEKIYTGLVESEPNKSRPLLQRALFFSRTRNREKAAKDMEELIVWNNENIEEPNERDSNKSRYLVIYGQILYAAGKEAEALRMMERALRTTPRILPFHLEYLIEGYRQQNNRVRALKHFRKMRELYPDVSLTGVLEAKLKWDRGEREEGERLLLETLEKHRDDFNTWIGIESAFREYKSYDKAIEILQEAISTFPEYDRKDSFYFALGAALERKGAIREAEETFRKALEVNPNNAQVLNYLRYMLADHDLKLDESLEYLKNALKLDKNNPAFLDSLGWIYFKLDMLTEAKKNLLKAKELLSDDPVINQHIGDLHFRLGNLREALDGYQQALDHGLEEKVDDVKQRIGEIKRKLRKR